MKKGIKNEEKNDDSPILNAKLEKNKTSESKENDKKIEYHVTENQDEDKDKEKNNKNIDKSF